MRTRILSGYALGVAAGLLWTFELLQRMGWIPIVLSVSTLAASCHLTIWSAGRSRWWTLLIIGVLAGFSLEIGLYFTTPESPFSVSSALTFAAFFGALLAAILAVRNGISYVIGRVSIAAKRY
jgi:hypothetical protein